MDRYSRQIAFSPIGKDGQEKLKSAKVVIIGMGALGSVAANNLCRAGIGCVRIVDRDSVELTNLQRQLMFDEKDVMQNLPKAIAAFNHLQQINSEILIDFHVDNVTPSNVEKYLQDMDLVIDATDNLETRLLINETCHALNIPWIFSAVLGGEGMTMNFLWEEKSPCLRCFLSSAMSSDKNSSTHGVLNMITSTIASLQTAEALKILLKSSTIRKGLLFVNIWENQFNLINIEKDDACPVCAS